MKKAFLILAGFILLISKISMAQEETSDFFLGKWNVTISGLPNGEAKFVLKVEKTETGLTAYIIGGEGKTQKVDRVETKPNSITIYWVAEGYDVFLIITKKEDGKVEGDLLNMFTAEVKKIEE